LSELLAQVAAKPNSVERVAVKTDGRTLLLRVEEIDWVEAMGDYLKLHVSGQSHVVRGRMNDWERKLRSRQFQRIHRSCIVNLDRIRECIPSFGGDYVVVLRSGERLKANRQGMRLLHQALEGAA
jgi:two-component system LytT family response regulator